MIDYSLETQTFMIPIYIVLYDMIYSIKMYLRICITNVGIKTNHATWVHDSQECILQEKRKHHYNLVLPKTETNFTVLTPSG